MGLVLRRLKSKGDHLNLPMIILTEPSVGSVLVDAGVWKNPLNVAECVVEEGRSYLARAGRVVLGNGSNVLYIFAEEEMDGRASKNSYLGGKR
jgi:hypothetical protein